MVGQITLLLIALATAMSSTVNAACVASKTQDGGRTLYLPDATVHTLFSKHEFNQTQEIMAALAKSKNKNKMTANLRQALKRQSSLISSLESDQLYFKQKLAREDIKWWGIEASPMEMKQGLSIKSQAQDLQEMKKLLKTTGLSNIEISQMLTLMYPPPVVLMAQFPEIVSKIKFVPLDDDKAKDDSFRLVEKMDLQRRDLLQLGRDKGFLTASQFMAIDDLHMEALAKNQMLTQPEIESVISNLKNAKARDRAQALLKNTNDFLKLSNRRDASAANVISAQSGRGLVSMGTNHENEVINKTIAQCKTSESPPPEVKSSQPGTK